MDAGRVKALGTFAELRDRGEFSAQTLQRQLVADTENHRAETKVDPSTEPADVKETATQQKISRTAQSAPPATLLPLENKHGDENEADDENATVADDGKLVEAEARQKGAVSAVVVCKYFQAMGPCCVPVFFMTSFLLPQCLRVILDFWLLIWLGDGINSGVGLDLWFNASAASVDPVLVRNVTDPNYFSQGYYYAVCVLADG